MNHLPENHSGARTDRQLIDLWLSGRPESTQLVYEPVVLDFLKHCQAGLQECTVQDLAKWAEQLQGRDATRFRKVSTIKSLFRYGYRTGYLAFDVGLPIKGAKPFDKLHEKILDVDSVHEVIRQARQGRDRILIRCLYATGGRVSEVCKMRYRDLVGNRISFFGKGRKTRVVMIPDSLAQELLSLRTRECLPDSPIFRSHRGQGLLPRNARQIIAQAGDDALLHLSPHYLRHSHASHALDAGAPIHLVAQCLGHANISTTSRYLHARPSDGSSRFLNLG